MSTMTYYKIRHRQTGKYHKGGAYNLWSDTGKTWPTLGRLRSFLTMQLKREYGRPDTTEWEVVEYEVKESAIKSLHEVIDPKKLMAYLKEI